MLNYPRILYFTKGAAPTLEEVADAESLGRCRVSYRNVRFLSDNGALEQCDGIAGEAPERYRKAYPSASELCDETPVPSESQIRAMHALNERLAENRRAKKHAASAETKPESGVVIEKAEPAKGDAT